MIVTTPNPRLRARSLPALSLLSALLAITACTKREPGETDSDGTSEGPGSTGQTTGPSPLPTTTATATDPADPTEPTDPSGAPTTGPEPSDTVSINISLAADILFVIDNSASMSVPQAKLTLAMSAFVDALGALDWRIGITTTDSGNPRCNAAETTPERGQLVLSSCLDRVDAGEFVIPGAQEDVSFVCTDVCGLLDADLPITPTATHLSDGALAPRPWVESAVLATNLPDGVAPNQALQCFIPQGVRGCGFESHLESMFLALSRAEDPASPNHGFIRPDASLTVILISDETDCSHVPEFGDIFTDNKVFWEDPQAPAPTSAACWNAGVACVGDGPQFAGCSAANFGSDGALGVPDSQAVLQPLSRYIGLVQSLEDAKKSFDPRDEVLVALFTGVPVGYDTFDAELVFEEAGDPQVNLDFGIGPGCVDPQSGHFAVPPVREREFAEAFEVGDRREVFSICAPSYADELATLGERIVEQVRPACMPLCVADTNPATPVVEPSCLLVEVDPATNAPTAIAPCVTEGGDWAVPAGETACFAPLVDRDGTTPSAADDMSLECVAEGFNLEFRILRTVLPPPGVSLEATCELSNMPAVDCPAL